jgi:hypothetical protein
MASLSASVLWCGVAGALEAADAAAAANAHGLLLLAQEAREFGCGGCNIIELLISGSHRMNLKAPVKLLQWKAQDFISKDGISGVEEFAARRGLMRMLQQEDHEVFLSFREWRDAPSDTFPREWAFSEAFDGRLLLLPFYHRAAAVVASVHDVTLLTHMDATRLKNLDIFVRSWDGPVSVVLLVCVCCLACAS